MCCEGVYEWFDIVKASGVSYEACLYCKGARIVHFWCNECKVWICQHKLFNIEEDVSCVDECGYNLVKCPKCKVGELWTPPETQECVACVNCTKPVEPYYNILTKKIKEESFMKTNTWEELEIFPTCNNCDNVICRECRKTVYEKYYEKYFSESIGNHIKDYCRDLEFTELFCEKINDDFRTASRNQYVKPEKFGLKYCWDCVQLFYE